MDAGLQEDLLPEVVTVLLVGIKMSLNYDGKDNNDKEINLNEGVASI